MTSIGWPAFISFLATSGMRIADPKLGIGREIAFVTDPLRLVVVHFAENESSEYISGVFAQVLALDKAWYIAPRYGTVTDLRRLSSNVQDAAALVVERSATGELITFLVNYFEALQTMTGNGLYLLARSGKVIVPYDHHSPDEGLAIYVNDISLCEQLLRGLNALGVELELLSKRG